MDSIEKDFIISQLKIMEIKRMLSAINPQMAELSDMDIIHLSLVLFELICDAHYDKGNERKKFILKAIIENDDDLFIDALKTLSNKHDEVFDFPEIKENLWQWRESDGFEF